MLHREHALTISLLALCLFYKYEQELFSLAANVSFSRSLQYLRDWDNMVNLRTSTALAYLAQVAFLGGHAKTNSSQLKHIVPKREILYVGGQYTNITASCSPLR
jgi:hypothetical protein